MTKNSLLLKTDASYLNKLNGFINIDKPLNITSMDVIREIRRATNEKKVGHAGTLDPKASGVLPVAFGSYTRLLQYIVNEDKTYEAQIQLGVKTNTFDSEGVVVESLDSSNIDTNKIQQALPEFIGTYNQTPPIYSAKKINGKRLYEYARQKMDVEINSTLVTVNEIKIIDHHKSILNLSIECGKGFYVRSLANDLGLKLGCGAHLKKLRRTKSGSFDIDQSITLQNAIESIGSGRIDEIIYPLDQCLPHIKKITLTERMATDIKHGKSIPVPGIHNSVFENQTIIRAHNDTQELIALVTFEEETQEFKPYKVFLN